MAVDRELTVENNVGLDLRITILHGSVRTPLGTVRGSNSRSFRLPPGIPDLVRIMAEPQGGGFGERLVSEPVSFHGEPVVRWIIRPGGLNTVIYGGLRGRT